MQVKLTEVDFDRMMETEILQLENKGYKPTDMMIYEPYHTYFEKLVSDKYNLPKFSLDNYIKQTYGLDTHIIGVDHRIQTGVSIFIYQDSRKVK